MATGSIDKTRENKTLNIILVILKLVRIRNCLIAFFGVLVGALLVAQNPQYMGAKTYIAALTAAVITAGGNALNDYFDHTIDKTNKPDRPIPSGKIPRSDALMLAAGLLLIGMGLAKTVNEYCLVIAAANTIILIAYAAYSKKMLFVANLGVSYLVASVFIFGAFSTIDAASTLNLEKIKLASVITVCAFFMTLAREIIKDVEDMDGDRKMYSKTLPLVYGAKKAKNTAILFAVIAILVSTTPIALSFPNLNLRIYGTIVGVADLIFLSALTMFPSLSQRMMIIGMILSLAAFFFGKTMA
ncbi:MAG: UbiA family prenyltransferase [Candidatus Altiarchaeota archaeon]